VTVTQHPHLSVQQTLSPFEACFVSYVNITLTYEARNLAKRSRIRVQQQVPLPDTADHQADMYRFLVTVGLDEMPMVEERLVDVISDDRLEQAIRLLTVVQREILYRLIVLGQAEGEVAQHLRVSQQAVNKAKNASLVKLRAFMAVAS
jgi:DNA-directed RNA polymerase specialized sigma24 family protein